MKKYILHFLFLLLSGSVNAQWIQQQSGVTNQLNSIHFINPNTGFCVGNGAIILKTTNGGTNWITLTSPQQVNLNYVKMFSTGNVIIGSVAANTVIRSTDCGNTWTYSIINIPSSESRMKVQFTSFNVGYFLTLDYKLYRTTNGGYNWTSYTTIDHGVDICFVNDATGWLCGWYNIPPPIGITYSELRRTDNGGQSWDLQVTVMQSSYSINKVFCYDVNNGFYNSYLNTSLAHTTNGGSSWSAPVSGAGTLQSYTQMSFTGGYTGWLIGSQLIKTTNSGFNWRTMTTAFGTSFNNVFFVNDTIGWLAGNNGLIIKTTNGGENFTSVSNEPGTINSFSLSQNYPNPFNPSTTIRFSIPHSRGARGVTNVKLIIYDLLGREVEQLLNEERRPGSYEIRWDGSRFASGVYFYKLITDEFMQTKKMLMQK